MQSKQQPQRQVLVSQPPPTSYPAPSPTPPAFTHQQAQDITNTTGARLSATPGQFEGSLNEMSPYSAEQMGIIDNLLKENAQGLSSNVGTNLDVAANVAGNQASNQDIMNKYMQQLQQQAGQYNYDRQLNYYQNMPQIPQPGYGAGDFLGSIIPSVASYFLHI